jgi:hypothetical protein
MLTKKHEKAIKDYLRTTPLEDQAFGYFVGGYDCATAGQYRFLPLIGFPYKKKIVLQGILLRTFEDKQAGTLNWILPAHDKTFKEALEVLTALGWDGRYWPEDPGWPDTEPKEEKGLRDILTRMRITSTLVFPPHDEKGSRVLKLNVLKTNGDKFPLPMSIFEEDKVPATADMETRLRTILMTDAILDFHPAGKKSSVL